MKSPAIATISAARKPKKTKVTCVTCGLQTCIGRCHFEVVDTPPPPKAA
jgi:hypothetical protein